MKKYVFLTRQLYEVIFYFYFYFSSVDSIHYVDTGLLGFILLFLYLNEAYPKLFVMVHVKKLLSKNRNIFRWVFKRCHEIT